MDIHLSRWQKNAVALVLFLLLLWLVDVRELISSFAQIKASFVVLLLLISVVLVYVSALKWQIILSSLQRSASVLKLFNLYLLGYFVNLLFPSYVGGDVARSFFLGKDVGHHQAFSATIVERYTGLLAMVGLALLSICFSSLAGWPIKLCVIACALGLAAITLVALSPRMLSWLGSLAALKKVHQHLQRVQEHLGGALRDPLLMSKALALSLIFHSFTVINTLVAGYAVGCFELSFGEVMVVMPLILLIGALPLSPSGLGLQEGAFVFFLSGIGATPAQALGLGILLRAKSYILAIFGWLVWLRVDRSTNGALAN